MTPDPSWLATATGILLIVVGSWWGVTTGHRGRPPRNIRPFNPD